MPPLNRIFNNIYKMDIHDIKDNFSFLGEGISRSVYAVNSKYVIKLAKGCEGLYQNRVEYYVYTHAGNKLRSYLCPIVWWRPKMLVMPRAVPLSSITKKKFIDLHSIRPEPDSYKALRYLAENFYLYYEDIESTSSWGLLNNVPVLIDYGCTSEEGDSYYQ